MMEARTAIEALRAGVPNRAAIRQMGTEQTDIEHAFEAALAAAWADAGPAPAGGGAAGIGMAGGFGTGKSHLLGYLAEVARQQGFVVSRVVVSKETPLSHPGHVLAAALRDAALPDRPDAPIAACVTALRERPEALDAMEIAVSTPDAGFAPIFAACLFLIRRASTPPETLRRIARLWSGEKVSLPAIRQALVAAGAGRMFSLKPVPAAELTDQLTRFVPLLFRACGYAGWCILLDEVELIGRYTPLQRALSYAWLGAWLGLDGKRRFRGIVSAYAITDDFVAAVINARQDSEKLPERLTLKGTCGRGRAGAVGHPPYRADGVAASPAAADAGRPGCMPRQGAASLRCRLPLARADAATAGADQLADDAAIHQGLDHAVGSAPSVRRRRGRARRRQDRQQLHRGCHAGGAARPRRRGSITGRCAACGYRPTGLCGA